MILAVCVASLCGMGLPVFPFMLVSFFAIQAPNLWKSYKEDQNRPNPHDE